jgi:hypothetical protein
MASLDSIKESCDWESVTKAGCVDGCSEQYSIAENSWPTQSGLSGLWIIAQVRWIR